jgi:hypothetical protein
MGNEGKPMTQWVEWVEPFSEFTGSDEVVMRIRAETAIKIMQHLHPEHYKNGEHALDDFIACHWATLKEL